MNQLDAPELNGLVIDYLSVRGFQVSKQQFELECNARNEDVHVQEAVDGADEARLAQLLQGFFDEFDCGAGTSFLKLWHKHVPKAMIETDPTYSRLDFYVRVYFAIIARHPAPLAVVKADPSAMATFKTYLEEQGHRLSKTPEFLPFYVLPHIPNPETHESFASLFTHDWLVELRQRLHVFLSSVLTSRTIPQLYRLLKAARAAASVNGTNEYIEALTLSLSESEDREMYTMTQYTKLQQEYQDLLGTAADLVLVLETVLQGQQLQEASLANIVGRLTKAANSDSALDEARFNMTPKARPLSEASPRSASPESYLPTAEIRRLVLEGPSSQAARVLQALRWHLIHSPPGKQRQAVVELIAQDDVLGFTKHGLELDSYFRSDNIVCKDNLARLLSCLSYTTSGRNYLTQGSGVLSALMDYLEADPDDTPVRQSVLQTMEQLCLRRDCQSHLLKLGFWDWLLELLEQADDLSDHTLQLAVAAFMNLSLRSRGKDLCAEQPDRVLNTLANLLGHEIVEIRSCVHGSLYALFNRSALREAAHALGYDEVLSAQRQVSDADMQAQLDYVCQQLESDVRDASEQEGYESDDGEVLDEGPDHAQLCESDPMQLDLDQSEALPNGGDIVGEELLASLTATQSARPPMPAASAATTPRPSTRTKDESKTPTNSPPKQTQRPASPPIPTHNPNRKPSAFMYESRPTSSRAQSATSARPRLSRSRPVTSHHDEEDNALRLSHALDRVRDTNQAVNLPSRGSRPSTGQSRPVSSSRPSFHQQASQAGSRPRTSISRTASSQAPIQRPLTGNSRPHTSTGRPIQSRSRRPMSEHDDRPVSARSNRPTTGHSRRTEGSSRPTTSRSSRPGTGGSARGHTGSSRPNTADQVPFVPVDEQASDLLASKIGSVRLAAAQSMPVPPSEKALAKLNEGGADVNMEEYNAAFSSRLRIPRTPIDGESAN
eukprot:m.199798 g.199798  ORF g.199798 m.199798 type:complete len:949 (-) comp17044_c0_seq1:1851-4697(-)